jgi:hypothetical protein
MSVNKERKERRNEETRGNCNRYPEVILLMNFDSQGKTGILYYPLPFLN